MNNKINQITILISQIQNAHNSELTVAQEWMLEHVKDPELKKKVPKLSVVAYHILDTLSQHNELTGIKIAQELERQMREAADNLNFELAADLRDRLFEIKQMKLK